MPTATGHKITDPAELIANLWEYYRVTLRFREKLMGGIPYNKKMIEGWIMSRFGEGDQAQAHIDKTMAEMGVDDLANLDPEIREAGSWVGFKHDDIGIYVEGRQVKAALKEAASVLRIPFNIAAFKSKVAERLFVLEDKIHLGRKEPDGSEERAIHGYTAQGPRSALKRSDYVEQGEITFRVRAVLDPLTTIKDKNKVWPSAYLPALLEYVQENGFGADRSQGHGRSDVILMEQIDAPE